MDLRFDAESFKDFPRSGFKGVAVALKDDVFELGITLAVEVLFGVGEDGLFFRHGLPERFVAHHDDVENPNGFVLEMILLQNAEGNTLRDVDFSLAGRLLAADNLEEGGFSAAICSDDSIPFAGIELNRRAFEERLVTIVFSETGD